MGPIDCPETSVTNYKSTMRNIPEERISQYIACLLPNLRVSTLLKETGYLASYAMMTSVN
jgi:hypothetical protein